jgi:PAS domain S-box-containing protein
MEQGLRDFWTRALDDSHQIVFVLNGEDQIVAVSRALAERLGCEPEDIVGRRCADVMHEEGVIPSECPRGELRRDGRRHAADVHSDRLGGDFFVTVTPLPGAEGNTGGIIHSAYDITRSRDFEDRLRDGEMRYRNVVENVPIGMFQTTAEGLLIYANPTFARIFGYASPAEMIALVNHATVQDVLYEDPRCRASLIEDVRGASGGWLLFRKRFRRKDGTCFDGVLNVCEQQELSTEKRYFFGSVQDVTEQDEAARALERSARLLRHGERLAHLGSWEWDVATDMCRVSEEWQRLHGLVGDYLSNEEIVLTCHDDDRDAMRAAFDVAAAGGPYRVDHRVVDPGTGEVRHLMTYGIPTYDDEGRLETVFGASLDVTERVRADEALREREARLQRALADTVAALGATVAMRDPYTGGHERRVAELACLIAERLHWSKDAIETIRTAALVHDIGKIAIPAEILSKPGRLSENEFELVKRHSSAAYDLLAPIAFEAPVADIVVQHHERLDGSGYPRGLRGDEILPEARVLAVADVVEAMATHRPYRAALPIAEAIAEIRGGLGSRYDSEVGAACLRLLEDEGFSFTDAQ